MNLKERISAFEQTGGFLRRHYEGKRADSELQLHDGLEKVIGLAHVENNWFIPNFVNHALHHLASQLTAPQLEKLAANVNDPKVRTVAVICAGNIPMVGWHDIMCVLLAGHHALIKPSSDDNVLIPFFLRLLAHYEPRFETRISFAKGKLSAFDAIIATGSNNTASHFRYYFGKYPHIIRHNRTSVAVLLGTESDDDLRALGDDIFMYFGLGCRNVSKLLVPKDYDFNRFFEAMMPHADVINNKKYGNNYDYHRAIYLLDQEKFLDNNFLMLKESEQLHAPVGVLFYQRFSSPQEASVYLEKHSSELQCVVGKGHTPFGYSQKPVITEFADKVDTMAFLVNL